MAYTWQKELSRIKNPYMGTGYGDTDLSSLSEDNKIPVNTTIKPIDREDANTELEKNEVVLHPDGKAFKVLGKSHKQGGTPVSLPENSFIFSDHNPLAISKDDKELFKFKPAGKTKASNTPASVVKREVDIEHHNRMVAIQDSKSHDDISKKSSELMLKKNFNKFGQVAFLQEEKKGFPQGVPSFSEGTAPLEDNTEEEMKQYRLGGFMRDGGRQTPMYKGDHNKTRNPITGELSNTWNAGEFSNLGRLGDFMGYPKDQPYKTDVMQRWMLQNHPDAVKDVVGDYGLPNAKKFDDNIPGVRFQRVAMRIGAQPVPVQGPPVDMTLPQIRAVGSPMAPIEDPNPLSTVVPKGGPLTMDPNLTNENHPILPYEPNVPLTPGQMFSLGASAYNLASINKYAPKRMQESFTPVNLERVNAQPYLNQINNQTAQAYASNQTANPIMARAANSQIYGKGLDQVSQTLGNIDNQNRQISNQENLYNNQGINRAASTNVQMDNQYYNQVQMMNQNYDNEKRFARNRLTDQYSQYRSQNDALEMQLASQPTFGTVWVDPKTGQHVDTQGMDEQTLYKKGLRKQAAPLYDYNAKRNSIYYTGAGIDPNNLPNSDKQNNFTQTYQYLMSQGLDATNAARTAAYLNKNGK